MDYVCRLPGTSSDKSVGNVIVAAGKRSVVGTNDNHVISAFDDSYIYACISERVVTPHAHTLPTLLIMTANAKSIHNNADEKGYFNRQVSSFRDAIQPGGQFPPEKGMAAAFI